MAIFHPVTGERMDTDKTSAKDALKAYDKAEKERLEKEAADAKAKAEAEGRPKVTKNDPPVAPPDNSVGDQKSRPKPRGGKG